jgi:DNA-binding NtrC family response regulator
MATGRSQGALVILSAARDYIPEPGALAHLNAIAQTASPYLGALEHLAGISSTGESPGSVQFLGQSAAVNELRAEIDIAARSGLNTLITGEPGTGKELAAHLIHRHSREPDTPIISTNCITLTGPNFLSALAGSEQIDEEHRVTVRRGLLEQANGGTLVLRELDTLDAANQLDLVQLLERGTYTRQGGQQALTFHGRIIGTSSQDLDHQASEGDFRRDLLHLVARHRIHIKPLRRRPTDIRTLAQHFVDSGKRQGAHQLKGLTEEALRYLEALPLHGNAVELRNIIHQAVQQSRSEWMGSQDLRNSASPTTEHQAVLEPLENAERTLISAVLTQCDGNAALAAEILGLPVATLERLTTVMDQSKAQAT